MATPYRHIFQGDIMFNRILVAVDASETSDLALQAAIRLASEQHASLRIVHVIDTTNINNMGTEYLDLSSMLEGLVKNGESILGKAETTATAAGVAVETNLIQIETMNQHVSEAIANEAEAWPADLIVIGTHGRRGLTRLLLGSVAEGTARLASKPVLLIPGK
jgi:nucleotide-binding universal stress UspA family protein